MTVVFLTGHLLLCYEVISFAVVCLFGCCLLFVGPSDDRDE